MGFFDGANDISANNGSNRLKPGRYTLRVLKTGVNQGHYGTRFIAEFEVLESRASEGEPTAAGSTGSWTIDIAGQYGKSGIAEVKAFLGACKGLTADQANADKTLEAFMNSCAGPASPAIGMTVATEAYSKATKTGRTMVKHVWIPTSASAPVAAAAAPPPPAPVERWFAFPATDPRHLTHEYNAAGQTRPKA